MSRTSETRIALVTGGGRGIGAEICRRLAKDGYAVGVNYRSDDAAASQVVDEIRSSGGSARTFRADVGREAEVLAMFAEVGEQLGTITALVNNAGIVAPQSKLADMRADRIAAIFQTNAIGALFCCREAVRRMSMRTGGQGGGIVNVSSVAARTGAPNEYIDYAASKGALDSVTRGLATEVANEGIRVNGVRPGFIYTDMHADGGEPGRVDRLASSIPLQRGGQPEEVANAIAWLLSDEASYVTGSIIEVAGGR